MDVDGPTEQGGRTPLVGRDEELKGIQSLLDDDRPLITITGPPGIGKTRVARRIAAWAAAEGRFGTDGVVFCDLSEAWTVADVVDVVAGVLDAHLSSGEGSESSVALLGRAMEGRGPLLVVLDNFEQLVEHAADTISQWIDSAPLARFLVTSRDRLRLRGESSVELPPLVSDQAVDLFVATAQRVRESFAATPEDRVVIQSLVQRLDGIPLAIELAAARVTVMSPQRMLDRIDKRFQLLKHGPSDGTPRQATLRAAIDWSWELLTEAERGALSQCSVFRGGFTLEDAEAVVQIDGDDDVLDLLEALCRKSLVRTIESDEGGSDLRFRIYESIRAYAMEHIGDDSDANAVFVRHADHYLDHAEAQILEFGSPEGTDLAWVEDNRDNIVAICSRFKDTDPERAVRAALCIAHAHLRRGPYDSLLALLESVTLVDDGDPTINIRFRLARGTTKSILGRHDSARDDLQVGLEAAKGTDLEGTVRLHLGLHYLRGGEFDPATAELSAALALCEADSWGRIHARSLVSMGMAHEAVARFTEAEECYVKAASIARRLGDRWELARTRSKMGSLCSFVAGRQDEARTHFEWALGEARAVGDAFIAAGTAFNLGRLELNGGQHAEAEAHLCEALGSYRDMANRVSEGFVRMALGLLHLDRGAADTARDELALAEEMLSEVRHALAGAFTQMTLALALLVEGDAASAQHEAQTALDTVVAAKHQVLEGIAHCVCCVVSMVADDADACTEHRDRARECLGETGWGEGNSMLAMAEGCVERVNGGDPTAPAIEEIGHARARVGWRLITGDAQTTEAVAPPTTAAPPVGSDTLPVEGLVIHRDGRWFRSPGADPVDLTRKRTLRPMLLVLARHREDSPGAALDVEALFEEVWQGERVLPSAKKNRIYVAIATLRKAGLDALTTRGDGYLLSPDTPLHWAD